MTRPFRSESMNELAAAVAAFRDDLGRQTEPLMVGLEQLVRANEKLLRVASLPQPPVGVEDKGDNHE